MLYKSPGFSNYKLISVEIWGFFFIINNKNLNFNINKCIIKHYDK